MTPSFTENQADRPGPPKFATHISGLDGVLHGGLPAGRMTLVNGGPGAGKTVFALEILYRRALKQEPGLFVTFEESEEGIFSNAQSFGWDLRELARTRKLMVLHAQLPPEYIEAGEFGIQGLLANLSGRMAAIGARYIVLDALDVLMRSFEDPRRERREIELLHGWFMEKNVTALLTSKVTDREAKLYPFLEFMTDCVLHLDQRIEDQLRTRRLKVVKYRGSGFMSNEIPYVISDRGLRFLPVEAVALRATAAVPRLSSGNKALDGILAGGIRPASSILLTGRSGTGKTSLAATIATGVCDQGRRVLYVTYEETGAVMIDNMHGAGIDLDPHLAAGTLRIMDLLPEAMGIEEQLIRIFDTCEEFAPQLVIIDAISAVRRMGSARGGFDMLFRLVGYMKQRGVTLILVNQHQNENRYQQLSGFGISSLLDTVIVLEYVFGAEEIGRRLTVLKSRGSNHSQRYHSMRITGRGIVISMEAPQAAGTAAAAAKSSK